MLADLNMLAVAALLLGLATGFDWLDALSGPGRRLAETLGLG